ncbi:MAG: TRAFs-binding domain-containing protein [Candidatus Geothermincolia bacterium]
MSEKEQLKRPLCFVLMPFGTKKDARNRKIDFDTLYECVLKKAIAAAGLEPIRADEERSGGIIQKAMYERLIICPFALADLTLANANVFYELGVRHAVRPFSTVLIFEQGGQRLPFDVAPLMALPYEVDRKGFVIDADKAMRDISARLEEAKKQATDSPVYQLLEGLRPPDIEHLKTDIFAERVRFDEDIKRALASARHEGLDAVKKIQDEISPLEDREAGVIVDLMLAYRDVKSWQDMIALVGQIPAPLRQTVFIREETAFALNRIGESEEAECILLELIAEKGPTSENYGLLGRVYKDRWEASIGKDDAAAARANLRKAIDAYRNGYEADIRDEFPGVNLVTLLEIDGGHDSELAELLPVVKYAISRSLQGGIYWDHASMLEIAVIERDWRLAEEELGESLAALPRGWQLETTKRNLMLIFNARASRSEDQTELEALLARLNLDD